MSNPIFKIIKSCSYSGGIKCMEEYTIALYSKYICTCAREELIELRNQLDLALNDQPPRQTGGVERISLRR